MEEDNSNDNDNSNINDNSNTDNPVPKKRGRKPKQKVESTEEEQVGQRKRGRKKKFQIESISKLRDSDNEDEKVVVISNDTQEKELPNQVQVSFGSLSITVNNTAPVDKTELRKIFDDDFNMKSNEKTPSILLQQDKGETVYFHSSEKKQQYRFKFTDEDNEEENEERITKESKKESNKEQKEEKESKNEPKESKELKEFSEKELKESKKIKKVHKILKEFSEELDKETSKNWPTSTNILCWWCCHSFDCEPIPCPFNYDESKDIFETRGIFCSWECSGAYSIENHKSLLYIYKLMNKLYEKDQKDQKAQKDNRLIEFDLVIAPTRFCLKAFGGFMSIEEFRKNRKDIKISTDCISYTNQEILEVYNETKIKKVKNR
jgi:hypothetical protein